MGKTSLNSLNAKTLNDKTMMQSVRGRRRDYDPTLASPLQGQIRHAGLWHENAIGAMTAPMAWNPALAACLTSSD
jgi:hypothetical protein